MKIEQIQFNSFRAYKQERFDIPSDKNIILFYGRNGFGKTSFFDGIEWGLTGKLERYHDSAKERNDYPLLRNSFCKINVNDGVQIKFDNGQTVKRSIPQKKKNDYGNGILTLNGNRESSLNNILVKDGFSNEISFEKSFNFTQLLSQELISNFIRQTKDPDRYKAIVSLFGLKTHKAYDEHIKNTKKILNDETIRLSDELVKEKNILNIEEAKLQNLQNNPKLEHEELERLYKNKVDFNKLDKIRNKAFIDRKNLENNELSIKNKIKLMTYLLENYNDKEKEIKNYTKEYAEFKSLKNFIIMFSKKEIYEQVKSNLKNYFLYLEKKDNIVKLDKRLNEISYFKKTSILFQENAGFENTISALIEYKKEYLEKKVSYLRTKKEIIAIQESIELLRDSLANLLTMKQMMYKSAEEFLLQDENNNLDSCPICENKFDINKTKIFLKEKLESDLVNEGFNSINNSIDELEKKEDELQELFRNQSLDIIKTIKKISTDLDEEYSALLKESIDFDILKESNNIVVDNLEILKVSIDGFDKKYITFIQEVEKHKEYKSSLSLKYYQDLFEKKSRILNLNYKNFEYYSQEKEKLKFETINELEEKFRNENSILEKNNSGLLRSKRIIELTTSLIEYFKNNKQLELIDELTEKVKKLEEEVVLLSNINNDYDNLKSAIKTTIDDKTKTLLSNYEETIKKFYYYLNPSVYMKELSIRIQNNPTLGNRLIFEVMSDMQKKHSPSYIFSSAQNNVLALSIFLSFAIKQQWSELDSIFLDDPIQNMDDINIHSFVDLIRSIQEQTDKQFFISTHDDRIYNFMLNKFGKDNVHTFEFKDYGVITR
ncbi:MAG: Unknown protein [uncultured Campylobacterales bacterium]|uniref:Rad50/SbcC-type AAA domain-containing protein n=1 Tax=uncultured Campylobacterales bacterium TaxID=352960 RepID=A0A6S6SUT1_9BACT|nr:MAG: Unknown protein [uncultured Campylobacterales bacterium]